GRGHREESGLGRKAREDAQGWHARRGNPQDARARSQGDAAHPPGGRCEEAAEGEGAEARNDLFRGMTMGIDLDSCVLLVPIPGQNKGDPIKKADGYDLTLEGALGCVAITKKEDVVLVPLAHVAHMVPSKRR